MNRLSSLTSVGVTASMVMLLADTMTLDASFLEPSMRCTFLMSKFII